MVNPNNGSVGRKQDRVRYSELCQEAAKQNFNGANNPPLPPELQNMIQMAVDNNGMQQVDEEFRDDNASIAGAPPDIANTQFLGGRAPSTLSKTVVDPAEKIHKKNLKKKARKKRKKDAENAEKQKGDDINIVKQDLYADKKQNEANIKNTLDQKEFTHQETPSTHPSKVFEELWEHTARVRETWR